MNRFEDYKKFAYTFAPTNYAFNLIKKFYSQMNVSELDYYINSRSISISEYLSNGIIESKDFELSNLLNYYMLACEDSMKNLNAEFIFFPLNVQVCITKYKFYLDDVFSLGNVIFITEELLIKVFHLTEKDYRNVNEVYIQNKNIYDKDFISKLFSSLLFVCVGQNLSTWMQKINERLQFDIIYKSESSIKFDKNDIIFRNPNTEFASGFYMSTSSNSKKYITLDTIYQTECKYHPFIEPTLFEVEILDGKMILHQSLSKTDISGNIFVSFIEKITKIIF